MIRDHLNIKSKADKELLINQAHVNTGHAGLYKTYVALSNECHWQNTYSETTGFVESCERCQLTKSSTKKPVGLLTPLNVSTRPSIEIARDLRFLKQLIVGCSKLIPGMGLSDEQKPHFITLCKVVNVVDRHSGYTYMIPCTPEIDADGVIDILERLIKPTVGLPLSIVSDQDPLFMSGKFQESL